MITTFLALLSFIQPPDLNVRLLDAMKSQKIVTETKRIFFPQYSDAYNPSLLKTTDGYLFTFRFSPDRYSNGYVSQIGIVKLNETFDPVGEPQILDTRFENIVPSQSEDARLFEFRGKPYLIFNDNTEEIWRNYDQRRDMYMAELKNDGTRFYLERPLKLMHSKKYSSTIMQKNWVPFEWNDQLLLTYSIQPHEILLPDLATGLCHPIFETTNYTGWNYGPLRGSSPPVLVDQEYLSFFHSSCYTASPATKGEKAWHYFFGAYTFDSKPPFALTKMSPFPIVTKGFYTYLIYWKRVIFPGSFVVNDSKIYLAYGKDDWEMWIATIDRKALMDSLVPIYTIDETIFE